MNKKLKMDKQKLLQVALFVVGVGLVITILAVTLGPVLRKALRTAIVTPQVANFALNFEDTYNDLTDGDTLQIPIDITGLGTETGLGVSGISVIFSNLPSFLTNPTVSVKDSNWVAGPTDTSDPFRMVYSYSGIDVAGYDAGNTNYIFDLTDDAAGADFILLNFDINGILPGQTASTNFYVELASNSVPSAAYEFENLALNFNAAATSTDCGDLSMIFADPLDVFNLSDISTAEEDFIYGNPGSDVNGDTNFSYSDVVAMKQCYNCMWNLQDEVLCPVSN